MELSPYSPGATPSYLAGRGSDLSAISDRLTRVAVLDRSGGPLLAFVGPRGLGKTSLLRAAQHDAEEAGFITAWVTGRSDQPMLPELARELAHAVADVGDEERRWAILHRLDQVQVEFGVPGARISASMRPGAPTEEPAGEAPVLEALLEDTARFATNHGKRGLLLLVDELQDAQLADRRSLLIALQHFDGDPRGCPVAVAAAGLPSLPDAVVDAASFGERSQFNNLQRLTPVAVAEALVVPAEKQGVQWSAPAVEVVIEAARGYPHLVQLIGDQTWQLARPSTGDEISAPLAATGAANAIEQMETLFRTRFRRCTPEQQKMIRAMAELGDDTYTRADIATQLARPSSALSRPRQELIDKGIIENPGSHGLLRFTVPGFAAWLRDQDPPDDTDLDLEGNQRPALNPPTEIPDKSGLQRAQEHHRNKPPGSSLGPGMGR